MGRRCHAMDRANAVTDVRRALSFSAMLPAGHLFNTSFTLISSQNKFSSRRYKFRRWEHPVLILLPNLILSLLITNYFYCTLGRPLTVFLINFLSKFWILIWLKWPHQFYWFLSKTYYNKLNCNYLWNIWTWTGPVFLLIFYFCF